MSGISPRAWKRPASAVKKRSPTRVMEMVSMAAAPNPSRLRDHWNWLKVVDLASQTSAAMPEVGGSVSLSVLSPSLEEELTEKIGTEKHASSSEGVAGRTNRKGTQCDRQVGVARRQGDVGGGDAELVDQSGIDRVEGLDRHGSHEGVPHPDRKSEDLLKARSAE